MPLGVIERARPPDIMGKQIVEFGLEGRIRLRGLIMSLEIEDQRHQGFGDEAYRRTGRNGRLVGAGAIGIGPLGEHRRQPLWVAAKPLEHFRLHSTRYLPDGASASVKTKGRTLPLQASLLASTIRNPSCCGL